MHLHDRLLHSVDVVPTDGPRSRKTGEPGRGPVGRSLSGIGRRRGCNRVSPTARHVAAATRSKTVATFSHGNAERAFNNFEEAALLAQDQFFRLREREVRPALLIGLQPGPIGFVSGKRFECDHTPPPLLPALVPAQLT